MRSTYQADRLFPTGVLVAGAITRRISILSTWQTPSGGDSMRLVQRGYDAVTISTAPCQ